METSFWARFVIAALAVWRLTSLLSREDGPAGLLVRFRSWLGKAGSPFDCFKCLSLWIAAPFAVWLGDWGPIALLYSVSISGAVCLLDRLGGEVVIAHPAPAPVEAQQGETKDVLLWSETSELVPRTLNE